MSHPDILASDIHETGRAKRLLYVVTSGASKRLLRGQLAHMRSRGYEVTLATSPSDGLDEFCRQEGVTLRIVPMRREISPLHDVRSLWALWRVMRSVRPDLVNASTPKAGLLGMLAATTTRTRARVYVLRGLRLETIRGWRRLPLATAERLASACAHRVVCVSNSLQTAYRQQGFAPAGKTTVLGGGSSNGVRVSEFPCRGTASAIERRSRLRAELGIPNSATVIGLVGRINRDKGLPELLTAFEQVRADYPTSHLLLVGDFESNDPALAECRRRIADDPQVHVTGFQTDPAPYFAAMDLLAHPSLREGFPNAPLEAAASGLPVVGFRVTGVVDAVLDGVTGKLVEAKDAAALADAILYYVRQPELIERHGASARLRVEREFDQQIIWDVLADLYDTLLAAESISSVKPTALPCGRAA